MGLVKLAADSSVEDYQSYQRKIGIGGGAIIGGLYAGAGTHIGMDAGKHGDSVRRAKNLLRGHGKSYRMKNKPTKVMAEKLKGYLKSKRIKGGLITAGATALGATALGAGFGALIKGQQKRENALMDNGHANMILAR